MPGHEIVTTVQRVLSVDAVTNMGIVVRFLGTEGLEHYVQVPTAEAYGMADMVVIAIQMLPGQQGEPRN